MNPRMPFDEPLTDDTEVSFVPMAAVEEESGCLDASQIRTLSSVRRGYTPFKENDVIFAKITPCMENGKIALATGLKNGLAYGSTEFFVFRPYEGVLPRFVLHYLLQPSWREDAERQMSGAVGQKRVPSNYLFTHEFLLPPAPEQARIVAKLDAALSGLERAETAARRARERLQRYRAAVLNAAVTGELTLEWRKQNLDIKPAEQLQDGDSPSHLDLPPTWRWLHSSDAFSFVTSGSRGWARYYSEKGALFIRVGNLSHDSIELDLRSIQRVSPPANVEGHRTRIVEGDILISITADVGMVALVKAGLEEAYINQHVALARPVGNLDRQYLAYFLSAKKGGQEQFLNLQRGATKAGLGLNDIRNIWIVCPPFAEQQEIVRQVERRLAAANRLAATLGRQIERARAARQSLLRNAFAGHLVPQDPKDEPASVLLERIRAAREAEAKKPKVKRMPKSKSKSKAVRRPLLDVLREHKKPMTPEQLFREAGFEASQVDLFYRELTSLRDKLQEQKPKASESKLWPHHADVLLQLKEGADK